MCPFRLRLTRCIADEFLRGTLPLSLALLLLLLPCNASATPALHYNLSLPRTALASAALPPFLIFFAGGRAADGRHVKALPSLYLCNT